MASDCVDKYKINHYFFKTANVQNETTSNKQTITGVGAPVGGTGVGASVDVGDVGGTGVGAIVGPGVGFGVDCGVGCGVGCAVVGGAVVGGVGGVGCGVAS